MYRRWSCTFRLSCNCHLIVVLATSMAMTCNKIVSCPAPTCNFWYRFLCYYQWIILKSVTCDSHKRTSRSRSCCISSEFLSSWSRLPCSFQCASQCRSEEDLFRGQFVYIVHQRKLQTVQHRNSSHKPRVHFTRLGESEQTKEESVPGEAHWWD